MIRKQQSIHYKSDFSMVRGFTLFMALLYASMSFAFTEFPIMETGNPNALTLDFSTVEPSCFAFTNGAVSVNVTGGSGSYSYEWSNNVGGAVNSGLVAGTYSVTVTDIHTGDIATGSVILGQPTEIVADIIANGVPCGGGGGALETTVSGGIPPYNYNWSSTTANTPTIQNPAPAVYLLSVTDANGCETHDKVIIAEPGTFLLTHVPTLPSCSGYADGVLTVSVFGSAPPISYTWFNGVTNQSLKNVTAGTYGLTLTDANNCTQAESITLQDTPGMNTLLVGENPSCHNTQDGQVSLFVTGGTLPYSYLWSNQFTGGTVISQLSPGNYAVTITDASGCTKTDNISIVAPPELLLSSSVVAGCGAATGSATVVATGGTPGYTYFWSYNGSTDATISGVPTGTYTVLVTDSKGCQKSLDIFVDVSGTDLAANLSTTSAACVGVDNGAVTVIVLNGSGSYSYNWSIPNPNTATINGIPAGTLVSVTVTDNITGCQTTQSATVGAHTNILSTVNVVDVNCASDLTGSATVQAFNGQMPYSYSWNGSPSTTDPTLTGLSAGAYSVVITDAKGCTATNVANINALSQLQAAINAQPGDCANNQVELNLTDGSSDPSSSVTGWDWTVTYSTGQQTFSTQNPGIVAVADNQIVNVQLIVTSAAGCTASTSQLVTVDGTPDVSFVSGNPSFTCDGSPIPVQVMGDPSYTYTWSPASGVTLNPDALNVTLDPINPTYTLSVTKGSCSTELSINVSTSNTPIGLQVPLDVNSCNSSETLTAVASSGASFVWLNSAGTQIGSQASVQVTPTNTPTTYTVIATDAIGCTESGTVTVTGDTQIDLTVSQDITSCKTSEILTASSNTPGVTFTWFVGSLQIDTGNTITVTPSGTTTYTVNATNGSSCTASETVVVTEGNLNLSLQPGNALTACENTATQIGFTNNNAGDLITFTWVSSNSNLVIADPNAANTSISGPVGTYTVQLIASNQANCKDTLSISVTINEGDSLEPTFSADLCGGLTINLEIDPTVAGEWNFGDTNTSTSNSVTHTYNTAGTYNVTFTPTNASCVAAFSRAITVQQGPLVVADFGQNLLSCENQAQLALLNNSTVVNPQATYAWSVNNGQFSSTLENPTFTFTNQGPAQFTLIVTDANGCKDTLSKEIPYSIVIEEVEAMQSICAGDDLELNPLNNPQLYSYNWTSNPADPTLVANAANPMVNPLVNTTYTVSVTLGGCVVTKTVNVTVNMKPDLSIPGNKNIVTCSDAPVTLEATSTNGAIEWSVNPDFDPSTPGPTYTINTPIRDGVYYVRSITAAECQSMDTIKVHNAKIDVDFEDKMVACAGETVELEIINNIMADEPLTYSWNNGLPSVNNPTVTPANTTNYTATVSNAANCTAVANIEVKVVRLALTATTTRDTICPDQTAELSVVATGGGTYTYAWSPANFVNSGLNSSTAIVEPTETTTFAVLVTDENGCEATANVVVNFRNLLCAHPFIFVPNAFTPNGDGENEFFMVKGHNITDLYFVVYDRWGEEMYKTEDPTALGWDGRFRGQTLTPDSYGWYVRVRCEDGEEYINKGNVTLLK